MNAERLQELRARNAEHVWNADDGADDRMMGEIWDAVDDLALEAERLRAALLKYGRHTSFCTWERVGGKECECGLLDVRSALAGTEESPTG